MFFFFVYFYGGLECVGHSFASVAHLWFLRDVWIRTQSTAVASWRATDLATHPSINVWSPILFYNLKLILDVKGGCISADQRDEDHSATQ